MTARSPGRPLRPRGPRILAIVVLLLACGRPLYSDAAPDLALTDLGGRPARLDDLRGRIIILNFWATYCIPCRAEMPMLADVASDHAGAGVAVIGASTDQEEALPAVRRFVRKARLGFPIWIGATADDMRRFGLSAALPATVFIDRDGDLAFRIRGPLTRAAVEERVRWLTGDRRGATPEADLDALHGPGRADATGARDASGAHDEHHEGAGEAGHDHAEGEEEHAHGGVGMEGASLVPS